ncbi:MAG: Carbohydrate binding family 6 [Candidatus Magasanikbacteria bacterium GW2011_GWA2_46_17]|uniref:Carbohydrate binding family 6 n=1 Tax=Candidatus Magasanikbacteria bacterium GW2011_GWA2_46_17 TaxID=1619042 RepID=A0A0G1P297_9BACT|nr:MAG: Carbohydrate binding family 6 [Candidatus Magasanikbacteria bacterium GW2011_GWA2_46_17]
MKNSKFEYRNSKQIKNLKSKISKLFGFLNFSIVSCFGFRASDLRVKIFGFFLVIFFTFLFFGHAQQSYALTRQIPLSGQLLTPAKSAVPDGDYTMRFAIYDKDRAVSDPYPSDADSASRIWTETQTVKVERGLWKAVLGTTTALPDTLNFEAGTYFLGIRINTDPEMVPRKKILPVPLAINSESVGGAKPGTGADNILQLDSSGAINIAGNITTAGIIQAANVIAGSIDLPADSVLTGDIFDGTISTIDLADGSITTVKLADGAVASAKLGDSSVATAKLQDAAVTVSKIADGAITTVKLSDGSITTAKLADLAVTTAKIADASITVAKLATGDLHFQNTDIGTTSLSFGLGTGTAIGANNFSITASSAASKPAVRYNGSSGKWQVSNDGTTFADIASATSASLQGAYDAGNTITTADGRNILFTLADTATDSSFIVNIQGTGNFFQIQDAGTPIFTVADGGNFNMHGNRIINLSRLDGNPSGVFSYTTVDTRDMWTVNTSLVLDSSNYPHILYYGTGGDASIADWDGTQWTITDFDSTGTRGRDNDLVIDGAGVKHAVYREDITSDSNLLYAKYVGSGGSCSGSAAWDCTTVDTTGDLATYGTSIDFDSSNVPHISYYDQTNGDLKHAWFVGSGGSCSGSAAWNCETVESANNVGRYSSIAINRATGVTHIIYYDNTNGDLRYVKYSGGSWGAPVILDGQAGCIATGCGSRNAGYESYGSNLVLNSSGNPRVAYNDYSSDDLYYAYSNDGGTTWTTNLIEGGAGATGTGCATSGNYGTYPSLAVDSSGNPNISYRNYSSNDLRYASNNGSSWTCQTLDSTNDVGSDTSIKMTSADKVYISYKDSTNRDVKLASDNYQKLNIYSDVAIMGETGNLGIGVSNPAERLDVSGNIKASGNISSSNVVSGTNVTASNSATLPAVYGSSSSSANLTLSSTSSSSSKGNIYINPGGQKTVIGNSSASSSVATAGLQIAPNYLYVQYRYYNPGTGYTYSGNTSEANSYGGTPFTLVSAIGDMAYFGSYQPFNSLEVDLAALGVGGAVVWEYYNGATWASVAGLSDGTANLTQDGIVSWTSALTSSSVNSYTAYWIRANITTTAYTTVPTANSTIIGQFGSAAAPLVASLIQPAGIADSSAWSASGTMLGINTPLGFLGNWVDLQRNGTSFLRACVPGSGGGCDGLFVTGGDTGFAAIHGLSYFGSSGVVGETATGDYDAAGLYGISKGSAVGDALRLTSSTLTTGRLAYLTQNTSAFSGTGLLMNFANGSGSFTGNFVDLQSNGTSKFVITSGGNVGIGTGTINAASTLQVQKAGGTGTTNPLEVRIRNSTSQGSSQIVFEEGSQGDNFKIRYHSLSSSSNNWLEFFGGNDAIPRLTVKRDADSGYGQIGINVASGSDPLGNLDIRQYANGDQILYARRNTDTGPTGNLVQFQNAAGTGTLFEISVTGKVGINTGSLLGHLDIRQITNGDNIIYARRNTDTTPSGNFIQFQNAAGSSTLFAVNVNGDISLGESTNIISTDATYWLKFSGAGGSRFVIDSDNFFNSPDTDDFSIYRVNTSGTPLFRIQGAGTDVGNVGIGLASPTARLHVQGGATSSGATTMTASNGATTFTTSASITINTGNYIIPTTTTGQARSVTVGGTGTSFTVSPAFSANVSAETFTIYPAITNLADNSGNTGFFLQGSTRNVGINTVSPSGNLDIRQVADGNQVIYARRNTDTTPTGNFIQFQNAAGSSTLFAVDVSGNITTGGGGLDTNGGTINLGSSNIISTDASSWLKFSAEGGSRFVLDSNNSVNGSDTDDFSVYRVNTSGTPLFRIQGAGTDIGNVGIGLASPTSRLHVQGGTTSSGAITMTASNGATTFTTSASITINTGDYIIPTTTTGQARSVTVGGTGTSFTVSPDFSADVTAETFTINPAITNLADNSGNTGFFLQGSTRNIGVGTMRPLHTLDVSGDAHFKGNPNVITLGNDSGMTYGYITIQGGGVNGVGIKSDANSGGNAFLLGSSDVGIIVNSSGNVGVNITSPTARLHVQGGTTSSGATTMTASNGATTFTTSASITINTGDYIIPTTTTGQARSVTIGGTGTSFTISPAFSADVTAETFTIYPAITNLADNSGNTGFFLQGSTRKVGIGTASPQANLQVAGDGFFGGDTGSCLGGVCSGNTAAGIGVRIFYDTTFGVGRIFSFDYATGTGKDLILQYNGGLGGGNVGINTTSTSGNLDIRQIADGNQVIYARRNTDTSPTGNFIQFQNTVPNATLFEVDVNGNVGIGRGSTTSYKLEVSGSSAGVIDLVRLQNSNGPTNNYGAQLLFSALRTTSGLTNIAGVSGIITDITNSAYKGALILSTADNAAPAERARIDNVGNVILGVNVTSGTTTIDLGGTGTANAVCHTTQTGTDNEGLVDCTSAPIADYAEMYPVANDVDYGDIAAVGTKLLKTKNGDNIAQLVKSSTPYQSTIIGIISNNYGDFTSAGYNIKKEDNPKPVALNGRVPVKVSLENGPIAAGDPLTSSSTPGVAMKAAATGYVIGKALEGFAPSPQPSPAGRGGEGEGKILVFVNPGWYTVPTGPLVQGSDSDFDTINVGGLATVKDLVVTGLARIKGDLIVEGKVRGDLDVEGIIKTKGIVGGWRSYENHFLNSRFENDFTVTVSHPEQSEGSQDSSATPQNDKGASWEYHKINLATDSLAGSKAVLDHSFNFKPADDENGASWRFMVKVAGGEGVFHFGLYADEQNYALIKNGTEPNTVKFETCSAGECTATDNIAVDPYSENRNYVIMIKTGEAKLLIDGVKAATHTANIPASSILHFHEDLTATQDAVQSAALDYLGVMVGRYEAF